MLPNERSGDSLSMFSERSLIEEDSKILSFFLIYKPNLQNELFIFLLTFYGREKEKKDKKNWNDLKTKEGSGFRIGKPLK